MSRSAFGDAVILAFLLAQAADGVFTYIGVSTMGLHAEANPLLVGVMATAGLGAGVTGAKLLAAFLGISLHIVGVHRVVAFLTGLYLIAAVLPWAGLLLAG
jgi:hypothetical protein